MRWRVVNNEGTPFDTKEEAEKIAKTINGIESLKGSLDRYRPQLVYYQNEKFWVVEHAQDSDLEIYIL